MFENHDSCKCNPHGHKPDVQAPESSSLCECDNTPVKPRVAKGYVVTNTPIVLTETEVQIVTDSIIRFPEPVLEVKSVRKRLKLVQCRLLFPSCKLFLKGFVRKNIQYETPCYANSKLVSSNVRSLTVDIPFSCVTEIKHFLTKPVFKSNKSEELEYYSSIDMGLDCDSDHHMLLSGDLSEFNQVSHENFNNKPYCKLIKSRIVDYNEAINRCMGKVQYGCDWKECKRAPFEEGTFTKLEEKMVIDLTIKVLQEQQIRVDSHDC
ncbi:CsxC family protein [Bacillus toyonensis]|uniref:CsxC family protein n=1 Tax=Bacillus toyonensis TaxID=155322 RepID=UPI001E515125|nr:DUF3794 domain-containing protein [Bacillus toyonensis]MEC2350961.1 DUF3794 domain-containing protein [Bacillus toyonensis]MED3188824.1 DUF3794 domain-containing protein [Bacillus toyonensis]